MVSKGEKKKKNKEKTTQRFQSVSVSFSSRKQDVHQSLDIVNSAWKMGETIYR